jgi:hypothetical protein
VVLVEHLAVIKVPMEEILHLAQLHLQEVVGVVQTQDCQEALEGVEETLEI